MDFLKDFKVWIAGLLVLVLGYFGYQVVAVEPTPAPVAVTAPEPAVTPEAPATEEAPAATEEAAPAAPTEEPAAPPAN